MTVFTNQVALEKRIICSEYQLEFYSLLLSHCYGTMTIIVNNDLIQCIQ